MDREGPLQRLGPMNRGATRKGRALFRERSGSLEELDMTSVGQAVDSVLARLEEAREAQAWALANTLLDEMPGHWIGEDRSDEDLQACLDLARTLFAKGYRKTAT